MVVVVVSGKGKIEEYDVIIASVPYQFKEQCIYG